MQPNDRTPLAVVTAHDLAILRDAARTITTWLVASCGEAGCHEEGEKRCHARTTPPD